MSHQEAHNRQGMAQRVATEATIFFGCTQRELKRLALLAILCAIPVGIFISVVTGFYYVLPNYLVSGLLLGVVFIRYFHRLKIGKPEGQIYQEFSLFLERWGLAKTYLCVPRGPLTIGRNKAITHEYFHVRTSPD